MSHEKESGFVSNVENESGFLWEDIECFEIHWSMNESAKTMFWGHLTFNEFFFLIRTWNAYFQLNIFLTWDRETVLEIQRNFAVLF